MSDETRKVSPVFFISKSSHVVCLCTLTFNRKLHSQTITRKILQELAEKIANHLAEAKLSREEAAKKAELAERQASALATLQDALATVVESEQDPQLKEGLTIQTKRQLLEILSPVKDDVNGDNNKKLKLEVKKLDLEPGDHRKVGRVN